MNVAIRIDPPDDQGSVTSRRDAARVVRVEVFSDLASAEPFWRNLESVSAVKTPYQHFDLLSSWQRHIGAPAGVTPFVVVGFDAEQKPVFLWPFGRARSGPVNVVSYLGGKHANFNFPLWRRDMISRIRSQDLHTVFERIAADHRADVLSLLRQPRSWEGFANPFMLLPHQPSPSESLRLTITERGEQQIKQTLSSSMRGRLRTKERRLRNLSGYRYVRATTAGEVDRLLDIFFPLKAAHMKAQALPNIFSEPSHEAFLREACHLGLAEGKPLIEIHAIEGGGEMLALFAAVNDGRRASGMFNTYTMSDNARQSPGLILLVDVIRDVADRGIAGFDLGVGEASYKTFFCKEPEPLFDSFLPLTPLGKLAAVTARASGRVKRQIKQNSVLWTLVRAIRQGIAPRQS
jgi:CelD/BcsL family acetyltransferase involved in cellulose biosynthesis